MKNKIMVIMCSLLLTLPAVSSAKERAETNLGVDTYEQASKNAELESAWESLRYEQASKNAEVESAWELLKNRTRKEARLKIRTEKEARKAVKASNEKDAKGPDPDGSAYKHANENARFKRGGVVYNNDANKEIRAQQRVEERKEEIKKKTEKMQDKGEGQVKVKF